MTPNSDPVDVLWHMQSLCQTGKTHGEQSPSHFPGGGGGSELQWGGKSPMVDLPPPQMHKTEIYLLGG